MTFLQVLQRLFGLVSLAVLAASGYLIWRWWDQEQAARAIGVDALDTPLYVGLGLLAVSLLGRWPVALLVSTPGRPPASTRMKRSSGKTLQGPAGERLHVETLGPSAAPALILTHGWGLDGSIWWEAKVQLAERYRVITWDLPGLGESTPPEDRRLSLDRLARALKAVLDLEGGRPALLVGHSIGGMTLQQFCRLYPETLGREVAGLVLENTTHTDPVKTTALSTILTPLQKPLLEPLMKLDKLLNPLVWAMNWQSYLSGSAHLAMRLGGFGTRPSSGQLDQASRMTAKHSPAVQAEGNLAMMRWDATGALDAVRCPVLLFIGERDLVTRPRGGERIAAGNPQIETVRVAKAGHMGPVECADLYNEAIERFADRVFTAGAVWADRDRASGQEARPTGAPDEQPERDERGRPIGPPR